MTRTNGSAPPVRGSHGWTGRPSVPARSIPAPCGGATCVRNSTRAVAGLSPPVRGSRPGQQRPSRPPGSIPARAGEPIALTAAQFRSRVYPRPCGGAWAAVGTRMESEGLSPPVRGSQDDIIADKARGGSIPARAGEPISARAPAGSETVYPRPCGGAQEQCPQDDPAAGLSPPVRGSPSRWRGYPNLKRSIPARAGEPLTCMGSPPVWGVYPRPCGGARTHHAPEEQWRGLSPPVRGSPSPVRYLPAYFRSIPARAGEPPAS